ncbi:TonB-dependent receptor [Sphingoaurantiacus capsulatus]|uniref:TonB-dependent receptor n=1 Tax=Sphingoaurantiacus capsulatus TaxID=1771310 RepID=A0ABV7XHQ2_9SPHN
MTKSTLLASASFALLVAAPAFAQDSSQTTAPATAAAETDNAEIIVTATRRAQALSDVPIAVSALSNEQLDNSGVTDIRALNQLAPSLIVSGATSEVNFTARIRGVGTVGENPGLESSVALFIDGVYRSRTGVGLSELGEIERVEVLRGPQGTLFGRNASAGLLNIVTAGPKFDFGGYASGTYGNYNYMRLDGGVTGPVSEGIAARIDGVWQKRDGLIRQATPGEPDVNDRDRWLVRGQMLFEPTEDISFRLIGDYAMRDENCCGGVYQNPIRNLSRNASGEVVASPNTLAPIMNALGANIQAAPAGQLYVRQTATTPGVPYRSDTKDWGLSGELNWDLDSAKLTSVTSYRDYKNAQGQDGDFNALDILKRTDLDRRFRTFTQELRLQGSAFDDRLDWLVGAYYADETLNVDDDIKYGADFERFANCLLFAQVLPTAVLPTNPFCANVPVVQGTIAALNALPAGNPARANIPLLSALIANPARPGFGSVAAALGQPALAINNTGVVRNTFKQDSRNYAFFTHNVFEVVPDLISMTVGARYTNERKDLSSTTQTNNSICSLVVNSPLQALQTLPCVINNTAIGFTGTQAGTSIKDGEWTGTGVLSFTPTSNLLIYGSYSKGYKAGGYNLDTSALDRVCNATFNPACVAPLAGPANTPGNGRPEAADLQFAAEKVDAYELGIKWDGPGIDVNVAFFRQDFDDFQLNTFNGVNFEVTNIASCKDSLNGADRDASALTGACAANRLQPGVRSEGMEIEVFANPAPYLQLGAGFTYLDSRYRNNLTGTNGRPLSPVLFQLPGERLFSSEFSTTGSITWTPPVSDDMSALFYLDYRFQSDINTGSDIDLEKEQDGYILFNGRVGLFGQDRKWGVELWGQNLLNKRYQQVTADMPLQGGGTFRAVQNGNAATANQLFVAFPGEPRMYGITVRTKF